MESRAKRNIGLFCSPHRRFSTCTPEFHVRGWTAVARPPWVPGSRWRAGLPPWLSSSWAPPVGSPGPRGEPGNVYFVFSFFLSAVRTLEMFHSRPRTRLTALSPPRPLWGCGVKMWAWPHSLGLQFKTVHVASEPGHSLSVFVFVFNNSSGESANAVPHYQKLCSRDSHIWGIRTGQQSTECNG